MIAKNILSIDDLTDGDVSRLFLRAKMFKEKDFGCETFDKAVLMTAFFEPSTRTRLSFEMAAARLNIKTLNFQRSSSSMIKGENFTLTVDNLLALKPDILVLRTEEIIDRNSFAPYETIVINGGDHINEHPSQALLDAFTLLDHFGVDNLSKKNIVIVGDVAHSRVAHSNIKLLKRLGACIYLLAPKNFYFPSIDCEHLTSFAEIDFIADAVMCLRVQKERLAGQRLFNEDKFKYDFRLTSDRFTRLGNDCVIMHPGPINTDVEIDAGIAEGSRSLIRQQVINGVYVRAALLSHCLS